MVCVFNNLIPCENCGECVRVKELEGVCMIDGNMCQGCGECNRIRECVDWRRV